LRVKPVLRDKPLTKITRIDIVAVLDRMPDEQIGNRRNVFGVMRRLFKWAVSRGDIERNGHTVRYVLNYSALPQHMAAPAAGTELLHGRKVKRGETIDLAAWDVAIIEEDGRSD
jgi:hypothetical protein